MAADKAFEWRMQGMICACATAKEQGVEVLESEIKKRNFLKADIYTKQKQIDDFWDSVGTVYYNNILTVAAYCLHEEFEFGKVRLKRFIDSYNKAVKCAQDLDYLGEHFVRLEDYVVYLNEKYNLGLDVPLLAAYQDMSDKGNARYKDTKKLNGIINTLRIGGFHDAADYLENKKGSN